VCFPFDHRSAIPDRAAETHVVDLTLHKVCSPQLAVDGQIQQRKVASVRFALKPDPDCPTSFGLSGRF
jgi:hypothetical protein